MTDTTITFIKPANLYNSTEFNMNISNGSSNRESDRRELVSKLPPPPATAATTISIGSKKDQHNESVTKKNSLLVKVVLYYHLPNDKNWKFESYKLIQTLSTIEETISLNENLPNNIIKYCMLFMMKTGILPIYEDPRNIHGGYFSYKVYNKYVVDIWKKMVYAFCGGSIMTNKENMKYVNGITISPKKNFCILKIWLENLKIQNAEEVVDIPNLSRTGVIFSSFSSLTH
jgi:hypothetical protein